MQRVTVTIEEDLLVELDALVGRRGYQNRSEALRDLMRTAMRHDPPADPDAACVAALVYVYDHARRDLPRRLAHEYHHHHDLAVATLHVHLDEARCMEVAVLRGAAGAVQHMAAHVTSERGVRHGQLLVLPEPTPAPDPPAPDPPALDPRAPDPRAPDPRAPPTACDTDPDEA